LNERFLFAPNDSSLISCEYSPMYNCTSKNYVLKIIDVAQVDKKNVITFIIDFLYREFKSFVNSFRKLIVQQYYYYFVNFGEIFSIITNKNDNFESVLKCIRWETHLQSWWCVPYIVSGKKENETKHRKV